MIVQNVCPSKGRELHYALIVLVTVCLASVLLFARYLMFYRLHAATVYASFALTELPSDEATEVNIHVV